MKSHKPIPILLMILVVAVLFNCHTSTAQAEVSFGNPNGQIVLVEYFDYNCPVCRGYAPYINALAKQHPNLKVIQRVVPVLSPTSQFVDRAVLASYFQHKFSAMQSGIIHAPDRETVSPTEVMALAHHLGLNTEQLFHDMHDKQITQQLIKNVSDYRKTQQHSVPVLVLYNTVAPNQKIQLNGTQSSATLQTAMQELAAVPPPSRK
tara:strand:- start:48336 stop:48953 length:618 start_codon:yes stop_codon:yes gene_type:complete